MQYNVDFEVCALVFLVILYINFRLVRRVSSAQSRVYHILLLAAIVDIVSDIIGSIMINHYQVVSSFVSTIVMTIFMFMQAVIPYIIMNYIVIMGNTEYNKKKRNFYFISAIPATMMVIITIMNLFGPLTFYIDRKGYHHAFFHDFYYYSAGFYLVLSIVYVMMVCRKLPLIQHIRIYAMALFIVIATALQYYYPEYNLSGVGVACGIFILYLTVENPAVYADSVTSALNRKAFFQHHSELVKLKKKKQIYVLALDNFKIINEVFGMDGGDELMRRLVSAVQQHYPKGKVYRYNSDIFALVLDNKHQLETDEMDDIRSIISNKLELNGLDVELSACVCHIPAKYEIANTLELSKAVDYAITEAKRRGKAQNIEISDRFFNELKRRATIEQTMLAAIDTDFFEVHYQLIYDTERKGFHSMEALARLNVPGYGYIPPDEFIKIAEQNGMINQIGMLVLSEVCKTIRDEKLADLGIDFVEVNLSVVQCMRENLSEEIVDVIGQFGIPAEMINLEITESTAAYSEKTLLQNMENLIENKIKFSLDDYGSGYSNINYIALLPFSIIKIDKEFVWAAFRDEKMRRILQNTIETFKDINFKVLAEGAESREVADALIEMGIDYIQGYYFSKPVPKEKMIELLK